MNASITDIPSDFNLQQEKYQRSMLENLSVGIMIIDPVTRKIDAINNFAAKIMKAKPEKIIGNKCHSFICTAKEGECPFCDNNSTLDNSDKTICDVNGNLIHVLKTIKTIEIDGQKKLLESFIEISERKLTENRLLESENRKKSLINSMQDLVFVLDHELRYIEYYQPENFYMYMKPEMFMGKKFTEIQLPESVTNSVLPVLNSCLETGIAGKAEYYINQNGDLKWYDVTVSAMLLKDNRALTCVIRDISEAKQNQLIINKQIQLQELLIKISATYINVDIQNTNFVINESLRELGEYVGADRSYIFDYLLNKNICTNTFEWCREGIQPEINNLQEVNLTFIPQWVEKHKNGLPFIVHDIAEIPYDGPDGLRNLLESQMIKSLITIPLLNDKELIGFVGFDSVNQTHKYSDTEKQLLEIYGQMLVNVENRKRSQSLLITQEEKYRGIISNMKLGFLEMSMENEIRYVNKQFCQMSGYTEEELLNRNASIFFKSQQRNILKNYKKEYLKNNSSTAIEMQMTHKNGEKIWWLINGAPQYNDKKELSGTITVVLDITTQKKLQIELEKSKIFAENAAKAKEFFLTNMSHEIRTPLNVIIGMIRELSKEQLTTNQRKFLAHSEAASYHLLSIVNNVLDMSKIEAGEFALEQNDFSLSALVSNVKSILSSRAQSKKIEFEFELDKRINKVLVGDPVRLSQVFINLLGNSLKFTDKGFVGLTINVVSENNTSQNIQFIIRDSGIGMSEEYLQSLFKKFTQENNKSNRNYEGTGLGMSISKEIIELMGGSIEVKSKKGEGTEIFFEINFPIGDESKLINLNKTSRSYDISRANILIVEDNEMNRFIARQSLLQANCLISEATNGMEAIEKIKSETFDLILMDIQMPEMDGVEATRIIRNKLNCKTPIIALTANAFKHDVDEYLHEGMSDFLIKPYKEEDLYLKIENNLKHQKLIESQTNDKALYSTHQLDELGRGDKTFTQTMLDVFVTLCIETIDQLKQAIEKGNTESIKKAAHKIKPSLENMQVVSLYDDIRFLEAIDKNQFINNEIHNKTNHVINILGTIVSMIFDRK